MIAQGTDGISGGDMEEGAMKGQDMLSFVPLHLTALERQPKLKDVIKDNLPAGKGHDQILFLDYEDWFSRGHDIVGGEKNGDNVWIPRYQSGTYIWTPPPAGGLIAVEQLRRARLKRENSTHIVIMPRLMGMEWKRQLFRVSDIFVELPFDDVWSRTEQHEPLILAVVFPFLSHRPW